MHRVDDDLGDKRNSDNGSSDELEAAQRKEKRGSLARKRQRDVNTTKNIDNNSIDQLPVSKMLKKIKQSIEYDENEKTVTKKKHMLSKLLGKFEKLDNPTHSSNEVDEDPVYLGVPFSANQSPLHLDLPPSPNNSPLRPLNSSPVHLRLSSPTIQLQHSDLTISPDNSSQNLQRLKLQEKFSTTSINEDLELSNLNKINVKKVITRGRPKRQRRPAIGAEFLTYGTKKAKKA
ncbi:uncharacterized protein LOC141525652 [Cotesia typhae]|uniref:uncharacterized protein LOC141525652 n=1 Tax=Cotesia typhae TaxID=2053667 RepID=UPI003D6851A2